MAFGGHFLSDVLCAGLLTLAVIGLLRRLLAVPAPRPRIEFSAPETAEHLDGVQAPKNPIETRPDS